MKLFIFGSTGDLVKRKVMKALQELGKEDLEIYAIGRREMDRKEYQNFICSDWCNLKFRNSIHYLNVDFKNLNFEDKLSEKGINYFYVSLPPSEYKNVFKFLEKFIDKGYEIRVLVEKPFGESLENAKDLKNFIEHSNLKEDLFILDHYLFKEGFINLPKNFNQIKIVSIEEVGLENRVTYYDKIGALKDMIQSHFLNLVFKNLNFKIDVGKIKIEKFSRGQYKNYSEELGKKSSTETFIHLKFVCCGKEFEFITGKGFDKKENFIEIDGEKFFDEGENSYVEIFKRFFNLTMENFLTIEDSILDWEIMEKFEEFGKGKELKIYEKGSELGDVLETQKNS